jgi:CheY-like chemotaxis protein
VIAGGGTSLDGFGLATMENDQHHCVVVLVEDESLIRTLAAVVLEEADFEVIEAASADEAVKVLEQERDVHMVFTDVNMPGVMDGWDLAHHVRRHWPHVGLLVTSGRPRPRRPLPRGCRFISKPYDLDEVIRHAHEITADRCQAGAAR